MGVRIFMNIDLFNFNLPQELIAQKPIGDRKDSKMMVLNRNTHTINHRKFYEIINYLDKDDVLVLNDTRVFCARVNGFNIETDGKMEFLLLKNLGDNLWEVMCRPGKRALVGRKFSFSRGRIIAEVIDIMKCGNRIVKFYTNENFYELLGQVGDIPLPPYIREKLDNFDRYQTVYSRKIGSVASPTAGLHFTEHLIQDIVRKGIKIAYVTLHIGMGTFMPVRVKNLEYHKMHSEYFEISKKTCDEINLCKLRGNKVIAVGTTTVRVLETVASKSNDGLLYECSGETDIFIKPGYDFKIVDSLITNFHLPKSTLLILVSAFYNRDRIMNAYSEAILNKYRFFSFGDSMFLM